MPPCTFKTSADIGVPRDVSLQFELYAYKILFVYTFPKQYTLPDFNSF